MIHSDKDESDCLMYNSYFTSFSLSRIMHLASDDA